MYLLPVPQTFNYTDQEFVIKYDTKIILDGALSSKEYKYAKLLQEQVKGSLFFTLELVKSDKVENNSIYLYILSNLKKEEYHLIIQDNLIQVIGGSSDALLHAVQTLRQIISQKGSVLPGLDIFDYPMIKNRGFYFDVTRGRIPTLDTLKALADKLSYYKVNQLQLYVEHSFLFKDFSEVWRDDTPLTAQEILEFDQYCIDLNIELVPSIASFGHLHKLLCTKSYENLCELEGSNEELFSYMSRMEHHTVDVSNEKSFAMIQNMLLEFMPLFSSNRFNICADETFDLGKGKSKELADVIGTDRMYIDFLKKICKVITDKGKQPMFWGDIIVATPEAIKELPENVICLNWDYCTNVSDVNVRKLYQLGAKQYLCPGVYGWRRLMNHLKNGYENISRMCEYAHRYEAEGLLNTDWGDYGHINHPEFSTAGMIYGAAFSWNSKVLEFEEINKQISAIEYLDRSEKFLSIVSEMGSQDYFLWHHAVQFKESMENKRSHDDIVKLLQEVKVEDLIKSNDVITAAVKEMYRSISDLDSSKRSVVKPYLVAASGMLIFNKIGNTIIEFVTNNTIPSQLDPSKLAVDLEYWFKDYKEIWREQYKESELYRIMEVIVWYADYLRKMKR
ncbi:MAG TPA: glycoside hydrolase family 20 zincin-like fold domain-containing protein [Lachnospiraceae bacterium]|nr:glycoside hydrolase family 20 zincin-like fold domain-containing protein [Lachnospiraceae bacterium]